MLVSSRKSVLATLATCVASVALVAAACGGAPAGPSASATGNRPTVVVQAPLNGAVVPLGQDMAVTGTASDTVGVDHVALFADNVSVASTPAGQPAAQMPFTLSWLATPAGPHVLQVIAYRADGTASDPSAINVVVGAGGSFILPSGSAGLPSGALPSSNGLITPPPTKKPKPSRTPKPPTPTPTTSTTSEPSETPSSAPTDTPTPTPTPTPVPTPAADGTAPDDSASEPHLIVLDPANGQQCPPELNNTPVVAVGCVWEQISVPGDNTDELNYALLPSTSYLLRMTSCSDASDRTVWLTAERDPSIITGCGDALPFNTSATPNAVQQIVLTFNAAPTPPGQIYNLYQFTVYQCQFANCGTQ